MKTASRLLICALLLVSPRFARAANVFPATEGCRDTLEQCVDVAAGGTVHVFGPLDRPARISKPVLLVGYAIEPPTGLMIENVDEGELEISFSDNSLTESKHRLEIDPAMDQRIESGPQLKEFRDRAGTGRHSVRWARREIGRAYEGTEYCLRIQSRDLTGWTAFSPRTCAEARNLCVRYGTCSDDGSFTQQLVLNRVRVVEGFVPYVGTYSIAGNVLTGVSLPRGTSLFRFVKTGHGSDECDDPKAYVEARSGESVDVKALFGSAKVDTPVAFVVCSDIDPLPEWIWIDLELTRQ